MPTRLKQVPEAVIHPALENPHKFENLDALRGIAAIIVVIFHVQQLFGSFVKHGYLAVDLFFMLSGFVLAFAYQQKLDNGLSTITFLKLRLIRLYPLYLIGLFLGFLFITTHAHLRNSSSNLLNSVYLLLPALFFLPIPSSTSQIHIAFPYDHPTWSLFSELIANLMHALFLRNRSTRILLIPLAIFGAILCQAAFQAGSLDFGASNNLFGIKRVLFAYLAGVLLYRLWLALRHRCNVWFGLPGLLLCALLATPSVGSFSAIFDLAAVFLAFPVVVFLAACSAPSRAFRPISTVLGLASYAIYVLHKPMERYFSSLWRWLFKQWPTTAAPWSGLIFLTLPVIAAIVLDTVYDLPVRRWLRDKLIV